MKFTKKSLLYDIGNMAYLIADTGEYNRHTLHRVRDICQDGNIDRVSRVLGLAYSRILGVFAPVLEKTCIDIDTDYSSQVHDYRLEFKNKPELNYRLTKEIILKIKETVREFMVCMVLKDWLEVTLPEAAPVWKYRAEKSFEALDEISNHLQFDSHNCIRRRLSPF